jgi:hypothetical protein
MKQIYILLILLLISSCKPKETSQKQIRLSEIGTDAAGPYLTKDNEGNPVICWAERDNKDSLYRLKYAIFNPVDNTFGAPVTVGPSAGMSTSPESMGKIAYKSDNTIVAVFGKSFPTEKNPFAGAIYYTISTDQGAKWSDPKFLHSDTSHAYGRSFFDISALKNGEVAAIWLDGRFGKEIRGSALYYASTSKGQPFGTDKCLYKGTCECCRTDLLQDVNGNIHLAYRSIQFPTALLGKQVRDMVYRFSTDNGETFSAAKPISTDNWAIEGCPHTGPSLALSGKSVNAVWFTAGGTSGIYHAAASDKESAFQGRQLLTKTGKHPQLLALKNGELVIVYEESLEAPAEHAKGKAHSMSGMAMKHAVAGNAKLVLQFLDTRGKTRKSLDLTDGANADHHAVLAGTSDNLVVSWVRDVKGHSAIYMSVLPY